MEKKPNRWPDIVYNGIIEQDQVLIGSPARVHIHPVLPSPALRNARQSIAGFLKDRFRPALPADDLTWFMDRSDLAHLRIGNISIALPGR